MEEIWKDCHFSKDYKVSNLGRIKKSNCDTIIPTSVVQKTRQVSVRLNNKPKHFKLHRLMLLAFDSEFDNGIVKFKNGNPLDLRLDNLEYKKKVIFDNEIWNPCFISDNYLVSNLGRVRNIKSERVISQSMDKGYYFVNLVTETKGNINKTITVHRLVMQSFKQNSYFEGAHINHINGIKTDNRPENLEWCTFQENIKHAIDVGLINNKGERNTSAKLNEDQVLEIRKLFETCKNYTKIAKQFNVSNNNIKKIVLRQSWTHI